MNEITNKYFADALNLNLPRKDGKESGVVVINAGYEPEVLMLDALAEIALSARGKNKAFSPSVTAITNMKSQHRLHDIIQDPSLGSSLNAHIESSPAYKAITECFSGMNFIDSASVSETLSVIDSINQNLSQSNVIFIDAHSALNTGKYPIDEGAKTWIGAQAASAIDYDGIEKVLHHDGGRNLIFIIVGRFCIHRVLRLSLSEPNYASMMYTRRYTSKDTNADGTISRFHTVGEFFNVTVAPLNGMNAIDVISPALPLKDDRVTKPSEPNPIMETTNKAAFNDTNTSNTITPCPLNLFNRFIDRDLINDKGAQTELEELLGKNTGYTVYHSWFTVRRDLFGPAEFEKTNFAILINPHITPAISFTSDHERNLITAIDKIGKAAHAGEIVIAIDSCVGASKLRDRNIHRTYKLSRSAVNYNELVDHEKIQAIIPSVPLLPLSLGQVPATEDILTYSVYTDTRLSEEAMLEIFRVLMTALLNARSDNEES